MPSGKRKAGSENIQPSSSKRRKAVTTGKRGGGRTTAPRARRPAAATRGTATRGHKRHSSRLKTRQALLEVHTDVEFDAPRSVADRISMLDAFAAMRLIRPPGQHSSTAASAVHRARMLIAPARPQDHAGGPQQDSCSQPRGEEGQHKAAVQHPRKEIQGEL